MELNKLIDYYFEKAENPKLHKSKILNTDTYRALQELRTLRKAYELMAVKYCKHMTCYFCEVTDKCELYLGTKKGSENLMEYFLTEAQNDC